MNKPFPNRKTIRLKDFDYSSSHAYFVTICCDRFSENFGYVKNESTILSDAGEVIKSCWLELENIFQKIELDEYIIMPNHFHGIVCIIGDVLSKDSDFLIDKNSEWILTKNPKLTLGKIIRHFKAKSTYLIRKNYFKDFTWQKRFFDRIVRNEKEMDNIREYIFSNPIKWELKEHKHDNKDLLDKLDRK